MTTLSLQIQDAITAAATKYKVLPQVLTSQVIQESNGNPNAIGAAGEIGLMQIKPATAQELGNYNLYDPAQNIDAGAKYLSQMLTANNGDYNSALRGYNAGLQGSINNPNAGQSYANQVLARAFNDQPISSSEAAAGVGVSNAATNASNAIADSVNAGLTKFFAPLGTSVSTFAGKWGLSLIVGGFSIFVLYLGIKKLSDEIK